MIYYIEKKLNESNSWSMVSIENEESLAIRLMQVLKEKFPNSRYRVVKYIDHAIS